MEDDSYMEYVNWRNLEIEHRILSIKLGDPVIDVMRLTCLLYVNTVLARGYPVDSAVIQNLMKVYRNKVEEPEDAQVHHDEGFLSPWAGFEDVLLWIYFIGAYCSHTMTDRAFFESAFRDTARLLNKRTIEEAQELLSGFLFAERVYAGKLKDLYGSRVQQW